MSWSRPCFTFCIWLVSSYVLNLEPPAGVYVCTHAPRGGGGTRVHHGRVGSAGLCDLKILHPWQRLKKGVKILQWPPPNPIKGGQYSTSVWKVCKKGGQKSTILKNKGVKVLQVWKWGSKFYMLKNRGQNSTMLEKGGSIFYIRPQN